jgi:hypothetical protein
MPSLGADISENNDTRELSCMYSSAANTTKQAGSPSHRGTGSLVISTQPRISTAGNYWTERENAKGTITTLGYSKKLYDNFAEAAKGEYI